MTVLVLGAALAFASLGSVPAGAHSFTKNDGNDSPGKLDLRAVSTSHASTRVVHKIQTWNAWTPASLRDDSFFVIGINKDADATYEKCAFIYYTNRLQGQLSNCRSRFLRFLSVAKINGTTVRITIPQNELRPAYRWFVQSVWVGAAPCRFGCNDFAPNFLPDPLHDLKPPDITMAGARLRTWQSSTSADFGFPFSVVDEHSGIGSWTVQRHAFFSGTWTDVVSGGGPSGNKEPVINGVEGTRLLYRVVAVDKQGNRTNGIQRKVYVPIDEAHLDPGSFSTAPTVQPDDDAFGGTYSEMATGDVLTYPFSAADCLFELIGPGTGSWSVDVSIDGQLDETITPPGGGQRQILYSDDTCGSVYTFEVNTGAFGVDAVLG